MIIPHVKKNNNNNNKSWKKDDYCLLQIVWLTDRLNPTNFIKKKLRKWWQHNVTLI